MQFHLVTLQRLIALTVAVALTLITACSGPVESPRIGTLTSAPDKNTSAGAPATWPISDSVLERGRDVYNYRCYFCHGYSGDAKTVAAMQLTPPPRNFVAADANTLTRNVIARAIRHGRSGTAMKGFDGVLSDADIEAVARFVHETFVIAKLENTRYHTAENGWPDHQRHAASFPFARGELTIDVPMEQLSVEQKAGRDIFLRACVSCHEPRASKAQETAWRTAPVSYPPDSYLLHEYGHIKESESIDPHELHERAPVLANASREERLGEQLYQRNCAHCHAADGTGRNWIGAFIEPPPRSLRMLNAQERDTTRLVAVINQGVDNTSMPAWRHILTKREATAIAAYINRAFPAQ